MNHAWNNIFYHNQWLLLDACWNDPSIGNRDENDLNDCPDRLYYKYFLLDLDSDNGHNVQDIYHDTGRGEIQPPIFEGGIEAGWF